MAALSAEVSRQLAFADGGLSLFWPVAGIGLAMLHRWGWSGLAALYGGLLLWAVLAYPHAPLAAPWVALASCIGPFAVWRLTQRRWQGLDAPFSASAGVGQFLRAELLVGAPLAALVGTAALLWIDPPSPVGRMSIGETAVSYVAVYWMIEACGCLLAAPVAWDWLVGMRGANLRQRMRVQIEALDANRAMMVVMPLLAASMASTFAFSEAENARAFSYLLLPVLVMVANRCGPRAVHLHLAASGLLVTAMSAFAMQRLRPGADGGLVELLLLVLFVLVSAGVVLLLVAVSDERRRALQRLEAQAFTDPVTGLSNEAGLLRGWQDWPTDRRGAAALVLMRLVNAQAIEQLQGPGELTAHETDAADCLRRIEPGWQWARISAGRLVALAPVGDVSPARLQSLQAALVNVMRPVPGAEARTSSEAGVRPLWQASGAVAGGGALPFSAMLARLRESASRSQPDAAPVVLTVRADDTVRLRESAEAVERVRTGIARGRLALWAQPIGQPPWGERSGRRGSCEILVRLLDEQGRVLSPGEFLPAAMQGGLMQLLDRAVIDQTLSWFAAHPEALQCVEYCSLNLSGPTMGNADIADWIGEAFRRHGVPPGPFTFEVTESQAIGQPRQAADTLRLLRALGCRVAIDDFGTGHATFDYLKRFPVDIIKIDAAFIRELDTQPLDRIIVRSMVDVARALGVKTVAEHVDSEEVLRATQELGIDDVQGYLLGRPRPLEDLLRETEAPSGASAEADSRALDSGIARRNPCS